MRSDAIPSGFLPAGPIILAWFVACLIGARRVFLRPGPGTQAERGMLAGGVALIGLAPVIWFGVAWLGGETTPFAGGVQLAVAALLIAAAAWSRYRSSLPDGGVSGSHYNEKSALIVVAASDERDREVTLKSSRNAYYLLFAGFVSLPFCAVFEPSVVSFVITWTAMLVLSELVYYGSVLAYYRLGTG